MPQPGRGQCSPAQQLKSRWLGIAGAVLGGLGVALGAFGAHGLQATLTDQGQQTWRTAVFYQLVHALVLLICFTLCQRLPVRFVKAGIAFMLGIGLFSGSLYSLSLGGPDWVGPLTPLGGLSLIIGWVLFTSDLLRVNR